MVVLINVGSHADLPSRPIGAKRAKENIRFLIEKLE